MSDTSPSNSNDGSSEAENHLKAVVKGGGPGGLAAAIALAQSGFLVHVIEKRPARDIGKGRMNLVALRAEGIRQLEALGAFQYALTSKSGNGTKGSITPMTTTKTINELPPLNGPFPWPLLHYVGPEDYNVPEKINEQLPSSYINLGDIEDCLTRAAKNLGVTFTYHATISLHKDISSESYTCFLLENNHNPISLGTPDLIICASGKNDTALQDELNFSRRSGDFLSDANLPDLDSSDPLALRFHDTEDKLESQQMYVFGIRHPVEAGYVETHVRKYPNHGEEPIIEIQMNQPNAAHFILQPPRSMTSPDLEMYILSRINARLGSKYTSLQAIKDSGNVSWGDPTKSVVIETSTAPKNVYGDNVVLVGDCAMSCTPSSGIGAEIALTVDSQSVRRLGEALVNAKGVMMKIRQGLVRFNFEKTESAIMWSQCSRFSYMTREEAEKWRFGEKPQDEVPGVVVNGA